MGTSDIPKVRQKEWTETPEALRAFQDYVELRKELSRPCLKELAQRYTLVDRDPEKDAPPTTRHETLKQWSYRYQWEKRIGDAAREHNERVYAEMQSSLDSEKAEAIQLVKRHMTQAKAGELAPLVRLLFELLDAPLPKQLQVTGGGGKPLVQVELMFPGVSVAELAAVAQSVEELPVIEMQKGLPESSDGDGNGKDDGDPGAD